jgi:hypothetical protein
MACSPLLFIATPPASVDHLDHMAGRRLHDGDLVVHNYILVVAVFAHQIDDRGR